MKKVLHTTVDADLLEAARRKREKTGRSLSHVISEALKRWVADDPEPMAQSPSCPQSPQSPKSPEEEQ